MPVARLEFPLFHPTTSLVALPILAATASTANAAVIAYWDFNGLTGAPGTPQSIAASQGAGTLFADGTNGSSAWASTSSNPHLTAMTGMADNALPGVAAGMTLVFANSSPLGNGSSNGFSAVFALDLSQWADVTLSYASRGSGSGAGFSSHAWSVSTDGASFTALATFTGTNSASTAVLDLGSLPMLDNAPTAYLRITFDGATASNGHNRLDNVLVTGNSSVPAPGAIALLACAGGLGSRRRRR